MEKWAGEQEPAVEPPFKWNDIEDIGFTKKKWDAEAEGEPESQERADKPAKIKLLDADSKPVKFVFPGHENHGAADKNPNDKGT